MMKNRIKELKQKALAGDLSALAELRKLGLLSGNKSKYSMAPVSYAQRRLWFIDKMDQSPAYNLPAALLLEGSLEIEMLEKAFAEIVNRHEILRTCFVETDGVPYQKIQDKVVFKLDLIDLSLVNDPEIKIEIFLKEEATRCFDLSKLPLMVCRILKLKDDKHLLLFNMHHIISDGWSIGVLISELTLLYNAFSAGQENPLKALEIQYKDYSRRQFKLLQEGASDKYKNYWLNKLSGDLPFTELPSTNKRPQNKTFNGRLHEIVFDSSIHKSVNELIRQSNVSLFMFVLAVSDILLSKYTGNSDILVGSPVSGRDQSDLEDQIGFYVNTVLLRNNANPSFSFRNFLDEVKKNCVEAYDNQAYPFDLLIEDLHIERDTSRNPLFEIMVSLQDLNADAFLFDGIKTTAIKPEITFSKMDLHFSFEESADGMKLGITYNPDLYIQPFISRLGIHFVQLLKNILASPDEHISKLELVTPAEKEQIITEFNNPESFYPKEKTIAALFEEMAFQFSDKPAVFYKGTPISYAQLNEKANILARILTNTYSVKLDEPVAVLFDRSHELIISILAILKAGGAYLPIDTQMPKERIETILKDAEVRIILTEAHSESNIYSVSHVISVSNTIFEGVQDASNLKIRKTSSNLAYILYTSGSSGTPKGTMIEDKSVIRLVRNTNLSNFSEEDRFLSTSSISFDATTLDLWGALLNGGTLYLEDTVDYLDPVKLKDFLAAYRITKIVFPTGLFCRMMEADQQYQLNMFSNLKELFVGGDKMPMQFSNQFLDLYSGTILKNVYGPTENACITTAYVLSEKVVCDIPIGKPISNTKVFIFDKQGNLCPIGVPGELCTGGEGLSRGYVNRPDLDEKCFVVNPHCSGERLYCTGDLAQWTEDGNILFLGRNDDQLKIRGFRIETGEIENLAEKCDGIITAKIVVVLEDDQKQLALYYSVSKNISSEELKTKLQKLMPEYMIPRYYVLLDKFPLNPNGKIDLKALPRPEMTIQSANYVAPLGKTEKCLVKIFSDILNVGNIDLSANFFSLGGHSLKAIRVVSAIQKELSVKISLKEFFACPDIQSLVVIIADKKRESLGLIPLVEKAEHYNLSHAQKRLWVLDKIEKSKSTYNIPLAVTINDRVDLDVLQASYNDMIQRHESLRTIFIEIEGSPFQKIMESQSIPITAVDFSTEKDSKQQAYDYVVSEAHRAFKLSEFPLLRLSLVKLSDEKFILFLNIHHIICDGWSVNIMIEELFAGYEKYANKLSIPLKIPQIQYKEYSYWLNEKLSDAESLSDREYWLEKLGGEIIPLDIPTDFRRPTIKSYEGKSLYFTFPKELKTNIDTYGASARSSLFMILTAALKVLLHRYSGKEDIIVGTPVAGRNHPDLEDQIGYYVNTLALRDYIDPKKSFAELLVDIKETATSAYSHQMYPFDKLVDELKLSRDTSRSPLFDVMIVMQNTDLTMMETFQNMESFQIPMKISKFDLTFNFNDKGEELDLLIEYNTQLYRKDRIERIVSHLQILLRELIANPATSIRTVSFLADEEKNNLLFGYNDTKASYPSDKTIVDLFAESVYNYPTNTAVVYRNSSMSYSELDNYSDRLAAFLLSQGDIAPGDPVGVFVSPSVNMIGILLGILKTGGAYVPIDPEYPDERIGYILSESKACFALTHTNELDRLQGIANTFYAECKILNIDSLKELSGETIIYENVAFSPDSTAYIIFTSGSTGKPKGCPISHRNLVRLLVNDRSNFAFNDSDVWSMFFSYCFDFSVWEIFGALVYGGKLVIPDREKVRDISAFVKFVSEHKVTVLNQTPGAFYKFIDTALNAPMVRNLNLRYVIFGGEKLNPAKLTNWVNVFSAEKVRLINMYGITETTIHVTYHRLTDEEILNSDGISNIGVPLPETKVYILDAAHQLVPVGVFGEIYVAGTGLSKGYLNRPELTAERFIQNPYVENEIIYKSGDGARWIANGTLEYLDRLDNQVQIRGYRVETAEIEIKLRAHKHISDAVVIAIDREGTKELAAYLVSDTELKIIELKSFLAASIPEYMIPAWFIVVDKIPLTNNGKLDKKALPPAIQNLATGALFENPETEIEAVLLELWQAILSTESISIHDNFFDLGGNSILLVKLHDRINSKYPGALELTDLFTKSNIAEQARFISEQANPADTKINTPNKESIDKSTDIAIVGIASRIGSCETPKDFWDKLCQGVDFIGPMPSERIPDIKKLAELHHIHSDDLRFREYCYLPEVDKFDPGFFKLSPNEASLIDPGQRLFMETAYHALEDAGYGGNKLWGQSTGVYVGASDNLSEYAKFIEAGENLDSNLLFAAQTPSILASRISYHFNLKGPALLVDTACSSSLVALHLACQSIRNGEINSAIVGGAKLHLLPFDAGSRMEIDSEDSRSHSFDDSANGTGGGEGVIAFFIKSLDLATKDGDNIYAVIKGSEINQDGNSNGITAPNAAAQADVIAKAWENAGIDPQTVSFIETHGTATKLGDPIEIDGITKAFRRYTDEKSFCAIGAVKANIGHLDTVAGMAGLLKAIMSLKHRQLTPLVHFNTPNKNINFSESAAYINKDWSDWKSNGTPLRCGVSSFGLSGTNCHVVLEEAPAKTIQKEQKGGQGIFTLSARSKEGLLRYVASIRDHLLQVSNINSEELCYTLATGRGHYSHRLAILFTTEDELVQKLNRVSELGLQSATDENIFYQYSKVVSSNKKELLDGEISENELRTLSNRINELILGNSDIDKLQIVESYIQGATICWDDFYEPSTHFRISLPVYPFEKKRCWVQLKAKQPAISGFSNVYSSSSNGVFLDNCVLNTPSMAIYTHNFNAEKWLLNEHRVMGFPTLVGVSYLQMAYEAGRNEFKTEHFYFEDFFLLQPLVVSGGNDLEVLVTANKIASSALNIDVQSKAEGKDWKQYAKFKIRKADNKHVDRIDIQEIKSKLDSCREIVHSDDRSKFDIVQVSKKWNCLNKIYGNDKVYLAELTVPKEDWKLAADYFLYPPLIDAALSFAIDEPGFLPYSFGSVELFQSAGTEIFSYVRKKMDGAIETRIFDITLTDVNGNIIVDFKNFTLKRIAAPEINYFHEMVWKACPLIKQKQRTEKLPIVISFPNCNKNLVRAFHSENGIKVFDLVDDNYSEIITTTNSEKVICFLPETAFCNTSDMVLLLPDSLYRIFKLAKYLVSIASKIDLLFVAENVSTVSGSESRLNSINNAVAGFLQVLQQENPRVPCRFLDIDEHTSVSDILEEVHSGFAESYYYRSIRKGERFIREIKPAVMDTDSMQDIADGAYLITGGTGGIGLEIALFLAKHAKVKLALLNRSEFPAKDQWARILQEMKDTKLCAKIKKIQKIEEYTSEIYFYASDVSDFESLKSVIANIRKDLGVIKGVVHAAGQAGNGVIFNKNLDTFCNVIKPKIQGTINLFELFKDQKPDFFLTTSALTAIIPTSGQSDYTAANSFLDAFVYEMKRAGINAKNINLTAWKETGMAFDNGVVDDGIFKSISTKDGILGIEKILKSTKVSVLLGETDLSHLDLSVGLPFYFESNQSADIVKQKNEIGSSQIVVLQGRKDAAYSELEITIARVWGAVLGYSEINVTDNYYDLGGDSILAIRINGMLEEADLQVSIGDLFTYLTVSDLAAFLESRTAHESPIKSNTILLSDKREYYPVSSAQRRLFILDQLSKDKLSYHLPEIWNIKGKLDVNKLIAAFHKLMERHEILRTSFGFVEDAPAQFIHEQVDFVIPVAKMTDEDARTYIRSFVKPFDLAKAPLLRAEIIELTPDNFLVLFDAHHIIMDAFSMEIMKNEIFRFYEGETLKPLRVQYKDYTVWQNNLFNKLELNKYKDWWMNQFRNEAPVLNLPVDYPRTGDQSSEAGVFSFCIDDRLTAEIKKFSAAHGISTFMVLFAVYQIVIHKYSQQEDIVIGVTTTGRSNDDLSVLLGMFVNNLPVRAFPKNEMQLLDFLAEVRETLANAFANQNYPFDELVENLNIKRDLNRSPLFDIVFSYMNFELAKIGNSNLQLADFKAETVLSSEYDLMLYGLEAEDKIYISIKFKKSLFRKETIERFARHFTQTAAFIAHCSESAKIGDIEILLPEEIELLESYNRQYEPVLSNIDEVTLLENSFIANTEKIALICKDRSLTYKELNDKANRFANYLRKVHSVKFGDLIGILLHRDESMVVAMLGIMKSGAAYVGIDPSYPQQRIEYIMNDSKAKILVTSKTVNSLEISKDVQIVDINDSCIETYPSREPIKINTPGDLAYVIYTSGSTGQPKGVAITRKNLSVFLQWCAIEFEATNFEIVYAATSYCFDLSVFEIFYSLVAGKTIRILNSALDIPIWVKEDQGILINTVPSLFSAIREDLDASLLKKISAINLAGEQIPQSLIENLDCDLIEVRNLYGPSEDTTYSTAYRFRNNNPKVLIGKPISNTQVYIADSNSKLVSVGHSGEICIAGDGLAQGYLYREELTSEKFIKNPFGKGRLYRTGDLGRWTETGDLEYLGRMDRQVKIRGFRIELGEIETSIRKYPEIENAVVVARENGDTKDIVAYFVSTSNMNIPNLKSYLASRMPAYMVPLYFVSMNKIPLTSNGKIDVNALPDPKLSVLPKPELLESEMLSITEEKLADLWKQILGLTQLKKNDNFFDLGGHSLKALRLNSQINRMFNRNFLLNEIFEYPTVAQFASLIDAHDDSNELPLIPLQKADFYEVSHAQRRMWTFDRVEKNSIAYNIPIVYGLNASLDIVALEQAFIALIRKYESLRSFFVEMDGEPRQGILEVFDFNIDVIEVEVDRNLLRESDNLIREAITTSFDLAKAPLMKVTLLKNSLQPEYVLIINIHHIVLDEWSIDILAKNLAVFYDHFANIKPISDKQLFVPSPIQYKEFASWHNQQIIESEKHKDYWLDRYREPVSVIDLPTDFKRPKLKTFEGKTECFTLSPLLSKGIRKLGAENNSTLFITSLALFHVLFSKYSKQNDLVIGTPVTNRTHPDVQDQIGFFLNTLALRNRNDADESFNFFLNKVRRNTLEAFSHQLYPFDLLIDDLQLPRDESRSPLFDVMLIAQTPVEKDAKYDTSLKMKAVEYDYPLSKFDLSISFYDNGTSIDYFFEYNTSLFKSERIQKMFAHFKTLVENILTDEDEIISQLSIVSPEEKISLLEISKGETKALSSQSIVSLIEKQVAENETTPAVVFKRNTYNYSEINSKANQLAGLLIEKGIVKGDFVGVSIDRTEWSVISLLAILKAGGVYVPIDPNYPQQRINYILQDSKCKLLISSQNMDLLQADCIIDSNNLDELIVSFSTVNPNIGVSAKSNANAYVIYTSGSTGQPKGVLGTHKCLLNLIEWQSEVIEGSLKTIQFAPHSFDVSVQEMLFSLATGGTLYLIENDMRYKMSMIAELVEKESIEILTMPYSALNLFLSELESRHQLRSLKHLITSGEQPFISGVLEKLLHEYPDLQFHNQYGPSETHVVTAYTISGKSMTNQVRIPIGFPINNTQIFLLDQQMQPVPIGFAGNLYIGGFNVASGYLNKPELTNDRFIPNPFGDGNIYKSGDLARWNFKGALEFIGRDDGQIKIRGFRVELGEIETSLLKYPDIKEAAVKLVGEGDTFEIAVYFTSLLEIDIIKLKEFLATLLPGYMIPAYYLFLESMPRTASGKIDLRSLPQPNEEQNAFLSVYVEPKGETEIAISEVWKELLQKGRISVDDNFFEIGGNSIKAIQLMSRVQKRLGKKTYLNLIFEQPTIRKMASIIVETDERLKDLDTEYILINPENKKKIFFLPPGIGYSFAYLEYAKYFSNYAVCGLNFIESENPEKSMADIIVGMQAEGVIYLFGHSAGGNMAFDVAIELQKRGRKVGGLVLLDSYRQLEIIDWSEDEYMNDAVLYIEQNHGEFLDEEIKDAALQKIVAYRRYLNDRAETEKVSFPIIQIEANDEITSFGKKICRRAWNQLTPHFEVHPGYGGHMDMLKPVNMEKNAMLTKQLIDGLQDSIKSNNG